MKRIAVLLCCLMLWTNQAYAAGIWWWDGSSYRMVIAPFWWDGSAWQRIWRGWRWDGAVWRPDYSTISVLTFNASGSGSGNSTSGTVTTNTPGTITGLFPIGVPTFSWTYLSGDFGISVSDGSAQNPTWSETITGVTTGNTVTHTAIWQVVATDPATSISSSPSNATVTVSWHNSGSTLAVDALGCNGDETRFGSGTGIPSCSTTATPSGGTGSYTSYQWTYVSGSTAMTVSSLTAQNPTFTANPPLPTCGVGCTNSISAVYTVTVTDSGSGMATSSPVTVELSITETND